MRHYIPQGALDGLTSEQANDVLIMVQRGVYKAEEARAIVLRPKRKVRAPTMEELIGRVSA
jgi:hypothetical protein